jgi:hypothetical protein
MKPLVAGEHGPYGVLSSRPLPTELAFVFMPALAALLAHAEELQGAPLTEDQVLSIRDASTVVVAFADVAAKVVSDRGYPEVDPSNAWASWNAIRADAK